MKQNISTIQSRAADKAVGSYHRQGLSIWLIFLCNVIFVGDVVHHVTKYKKSVNSNIIQRKNVYGFIRCQPLRTDLFDLFVLIKNASFISVCRGTRETESKGECCLFTFPPQQCFKVSINKEVHLIRALLQSKISLNMTSCMYVLERKPICSSLPRPPLGLGSNHLSFFVAFPFFFFVFFGFVAVFLQIIIFSSCLLYF